ncbi:transposase [Nitrosomonas sp.]|uniref:transposase n=1 Tax=Nitrosomonas sp. TaxID=42353 RepID=UPI00261F3F0D|nr:transposase [Nitrosomonas sp.]
MMHFEAAIDVAHIEANRVYADKGSGSERQSAVFKKQIKSAIHASRVQEQTTLVWPCQLANQLISKKRYIVKQCFGTIKRLFRMGRASYFGTVKANAQVILKSICMNLKKAANKIFVDQPLRGAIRPNVA